MNATNSYSYTHCNRETDMAGYRASYNERAMRVGERIEQRLAELGMSQAELARRVKVSQPTINALVHGDSASSKHLHRIAAELETNPAWLAGETEDMSANAPAPSAMDALADKLDLQMVPELELGYSMGGGTVFASYEQKGIVPFQRSWLRSMAKDALADLFVARGEGDSMQPTLLDGDIVLIDSSQRNIGSQDRIWAVSYGDLAMIKRVRRQPGGSYLLMSDNPAVTPIECVDEEMHVIGRVVWIGRRM